MSPSRRYVVPGQLKASRAALVALGVIFFGHATAAGSVDAGKAKAAVCAACHGNDGNSLNPEWPSLAGQHETYIVNTLKAFRSGARKNVLMAGQVVPLSDQDMEDLAAYFAAQNRQTHTADAKLITTGERVYRGGNKATGVAACIACHGPNGRGNLPAGYPAIGAQYSVYTTNQLKAYRSGERRAADPNDLKNQTMRNVAERLTDAEIDAVASYIQGLR